MAFDYVKQHLLFPTFCLLMIQWSSVELRNSKQSIKEILLKYKMASRQKVNFDKTTISFSKAIRAKKRSHITHCLDIHEVLAHDKYLGLPTVIGKSRKKPFLFIIDCIWKWMGGWMETLVSWAGREVQIKAVAQAILTYAMSILIFQGALCVNLVID